MEISEIKEIKLTDIKLDGVNVRTDLNTPYSQENLQELAASIKVHGLMQPILLKGEFGKPPYGIIIGQRRFLAHQILKKETIYATFSGKIDNTDALLLSLSENICRQELNFNDTQNAITILYNHFNKDIYKVKEHLGLSVHTIRSYIKIEEQASKKIKKLLNEKKVTMADAKRAIDASQGDLNKADILVEELSKLTKYEKKRVVDIGQSKSSSNAHEILSEARKQRVEESIILNLPLDVHEALKKASEKLSMDGEEIALNALKQWLRTNDFLN